MSRLIAAGDARVRPLLLEAWEITSKGHGEFAGARDCVLHLAVYLYGLDAAKCPGVYEWTERAGAVCLKRRERFDEPGWYEMANNPPPLAETIGEAALRKLLDDTSANLAGGSDNENGGLLHDFIAPFSACFSRVPYFEGQRIRSVDRCSAAFVAPDFQLKIT